MVVVPNLEIELYLKLEISSNFLFRIIFKLDNYSRKDIEDNLLGSKPAEELLHEIKPAYWFAAHLHCKFPALVEHGVRLLH